VGRKHILGIILTLILVSMLTLSVNVWPAKAAGIPIIISSNGGVFPEGSPIQQIGDTYYYVLTDDIFDRTIVVARSNIILDGNGYTLQGLGTGCGINITVSQYAPMPGINNVTITNINIKNFTRGIYFNSTSFNTLSRANITNNYEGIRLEKGRSNTFSENNIINNSRGFWLQHSSNNNNISGNNISDNEDFGIMLQESSNNIILKNTMINNTNGAVELEVYCLNNIICLNNITQGGIGLGSYSDGNNITKNTLLYDGLFIDNSYQNKVENNTVNGKPIVCYEDKSDLTVEEDVGQVLIIRCNRMRVENLSISNVDYCIMLEATSNTIIKGNNLTANGYGMWLSSSSNTSVVENHIANGGQCIEIEGSLGGNFVSGNSLINSSCGIGVVGFSMFDRPLPFRSMIVSNNIANNTNGLVMWEALNWGIAENNITGSHNRGIWLSQGIHPNQTNTCFYHNNVVNNTVQIFFGYKSTYVWDNGFLEGNYWNDYNGTDGDGNGIGDTPKILDSINRDKYLLMSPYIRGDYNHDGTVNMTDADVVKQAWQSRKGEANYNPPVDFNMDGIINIKDAAVIGINWQKHV
jgi:parallel beta-helix repeat protein